MADVRSADGGRRAPAAGDLPQGRYGTAATGVGRDARTDRRLKIVGGVLAVLSLAGICWFGADYVGGQAVSGQVIKFKVVSGRTVEVHLEVRKDAEVGGVCTLRARSADGAEVGRKDVTVAGDAEQVDTVASLRTTRRATSAELLGCEPRETEGH
ncbi:hypothetical protein DB35_15055 [Streptomyces abyssalis]|uniref:DUF4307 domain-containing protein n=1 Tax=Streptomyces abyssalis TaxID=933944 RepID=A0A1E7JIG2_9ACTN|nr:DUF4307 domain-containing protein [Streptomyces abyssalis]OEU86265.1 hypothetical protein AN215_22955 [Streptomyces abyssalis]OEU93385.1 hypothetical protein DB35_15055 [Streptomyces abyssalis]